MARAMLFPSVGEGFGIPPMEALQAGVPVVVSDTLPALEGLPGGGQIRLAEVSAGAIGQAVRRLLDDGVARALWADAAALDVPGWDVFARRVAAWVQA